jgi:REP element-mobilizing transposase RayT
VKDKQLTLPFRHRGGRRKGAGRPPNGKTAMVSHLERPKFEKVTPAHVTLRIANDIPSLRSSRRFALIRSCFAKAKQKDKLRLVEFTVLSNHLHLIVEADSSTKLSRGVQGLCVRLARALNGALKRSGRVFADHFHSRLLRSPTALVHAIRYVLDNARQHYGGSGVDFFSSESPEAAELLSSRESWLLRAGWMRAPRRLLARLLELPRYRRRLSAWRAWLD